MNQNGKKYTVLQQFILQTNTVDALNTFLISTQCMYLSKRKLTGLLRKKTETPPTRGAAGIRGRRITRRLPRIYRKKIYSTNLGQQISSRVG